MLSSRALAGLLVVGGALCAIARADHDHHPPPQAYEACASAKTGDTCSVIFGEQTMPGTCAASPDNAAALACRPDHPHGPRPEAIAACQRSKSGDVCSVTFGEHTVAGTCDNGRHGHRPLACHPAGGPHRHHE
jgi:hypothetical protein